MLGSWVSFLAKDGEHRVHLLPTRLYNVKLADMKAYPWLKPLGQENMAKESKRHRHDEGCYTVSAMLWQS